MGKERDTLRTEVVAVIVMERVEIGMVTAHVMEMAAAMEMDTDTQKAVAVMLMAIGMERPGMEEAQADTGKAGVQVMVGMERAGKKAVIVKARWTPRWTATRWTARQIRHLMVLLSQSHPNAKRVDGTVKRLCVKREVSCL